MSFLNGLRKAHLLRRKALDATNSRITQPLMEETQKTSITLQPTEQHAIDCCLMESATDVTDDRNEIRQIVDASFVATTISTNTTASISNNTKTTTTKTLIPPQTTTSLVTITTASPINTTVTAAAVANPLGTLTPILETGISSSANSTCNKTNACNESCTTTPAVSIELDCLIAVANPNSTLISNNNNFSLDDHKLLDDAL